MSGTGRVVLGVLSCAPALLLLAWVLLYGGAALAYYEQLMAFMAQDVTPSLVGDRPQLGIGLLVGGVVLGVVLVLGAIGWVVFRARLSAAGKLLWVLALSLAGFVTMPVLWWQQVGRQGA